MKKLKQNILFIGAIIVIVLFFSLSVFRDFDNSGVEETEFQLLVESEKVEEDVENEPQKIIVDIKGAIKKPGVYEMEDGDRVFDAIEKANGLQEKANENLVNLAQTLKDEMVIYVPFQGEEEQLDLLAVKQPTYEQEKGKININIATIEELQELPGIGPQKASAIIAFRDENGRFKTAEDLSLVSGIGEKTVEKMKDFIVVN